MSSYILSISCHDEKGIVHKVTGVLFRHDLNINEQHEHVDLASNRFFMRVEASGVVDVAAVTKELKQAAPTAAEILFEPRHRKKILIFAGKEAHCLGDLLLRHGYGELEADIVAVVSNHVQLEELVEKFSLPFHCLPLGTNSREQHEASILKTIAQYAADYLVLAKYMRVLTKDFVDRFPSRIINIHHSFLPAFIGAKPYQQAFERGVKIIGASAHFVTPGLDEGPIIAQDVLPTNHSKSAAEMRQAGRDVEKTVLARALRLVLEHRVFVHQNRTIIFD